jgi:hypothetical protein
VISYSIERKGCRELSIDQVKNGGDDWIDACLATVGAREGASDVDQND